MNFAIILSGGKGVRLGGNIPKQYLKVADKPIIAYALRVFNENENINSIIVVAATEWQELIRECLQNENITKFKGFANAGSSRQQSILNGMKKAYEMGADDSDKIIIHDAARPNVTATTIADCFDGLKEADGVMPALPLKDTVYLSENGESIQSLLNRDHLYAGQAPEAFVLGKYFGIQEDMSEDELSQVRGSSEIAFKEGLYVKIISGDEHNYKITTMADLNKFKKEREYHESI